ncbi:30S ribosomal protein S21, chloroplastic-like [Carya illinoinensis]|nr:30S ribosomal protein S21, chloroplastic-like [Carya illinoinensis]
MANAITHVLAADLDVKIFTTSSSSLYNILSFLFPSKPSFPPPPPQLATFQVQKPKNGLVPLESQDAPLNSSSSSLASVICPTLAYANTLQHKERLLNRFRREVMRACVIQECKRSRFFENKQDEKKRRNREATKRNKKSRPQLRTPPETKREATTDKKEDDEDNWDLTEEGDIPY